MLSFSSIRALTFDCYGTLIDWERGLLAALRPWAGPAPTDDDLLARFGALESDTQRRHPSMLYRDVLAEVGRRFSAAPGSTPDESLARSLAGSIADWPAFADTPGALRTLAPRALLVVISNVDHQSFKLTLPHLGVSLDALVTAQDARAYKPDPAPFRLALSLLAERGVAPTQVLHVAQSLYHDHLPAKALGLRTVFINRRAGRHGWGATPPPSAPVSPDFEFHSLSAFAEAFVSRTATTA